MDEARKLLESKEYEKYLKRIEEIYDLDKSEDNKATLDEAVKIFEIYKEYLDFKKKDFNDYYKILDVKEDASEEEIKSQYKRLVLKFHPDRSRIPETRDIMAVIINAYNTLRDTTTRRRYDSSRRNNNFSEFEENNFNNLRRRRRSNINFTDLEEFREIFGSQFGIYNRMYNFDHYNDILRNFYGFERRRNSTVLQVEGFTPIKLFLIFFGILLLYLLGF